MDFFTDLSLYLWNYDYGYSTPWIDVNTYQISSPSNSNSLVDLYWAGNQYVWDNYGHRYDYNVRYDVSFNTAFYTTIGWAFEYSQSGNWVDAQATFSASDGSCGGYVLNSMAGYN